MITITPRAAEQIRNSAEATDAQGMFLRIGVRQGEDGNLDYGLGFDQKSDTDLHLTSEGIDVVISEGAKELLMGAVLDYVEINPGEFRFIFINPNDPMHSKPKDADPAKD
jgi:iron-sulfur cluster assembly protein